MNELEDETDREWYHRHNSWRFIFTRWISNLTNGTIRSPHFHSVVAFHQREDTQNIERSRISPEENIKIRAFWSVEFYTPDNINKLYGALDRLQPSGSAGVDRRPGDWLRQHRSAYGSWMEIHLARKGQDIWGSGYWCALPQFASHASCTIICVTPSLTVLASHFVMNESERTWLNDELHLDHPARITQKSHGVVAVSGAEREKAQLVLEKRQSWLAQLTAWHRDTFPGLLSTNGEQVTACELSTLEGVLPLQLTSERSNLLDAIGLYWAYNVFEGPAGAEAKPFQFSFESDYENLPEMMFLTTTEEQFRSQNIDNFCTDDIACLACLDNNFRSTFVNVALLRILRFYDLRMVRARDGAAAIVGNKKAVKALARVRSNTAQCIDASIVSRELCYALDRGYLRFRGMEFTRRVEGLREKPVKLSATVYAEITTRAESLSADVERLNDTLHAQASLLSAHANLKLQPWIIALAVLSLLATVAAAISPVKELLGLNAAKSEKSTANS